jgi:hypothetical protein
VPRVAITSFYPKVEFLDGKCLGDGPYNTCYQECDYCKVFKKIYIQNKPVMTKALKESLFLTAEIVMTLY